MIRVGVVLPSFRMDTKTALTAARQADEGGLDGVFVYDHLFPMGSPERPAISCFPLLGAVAASTSRVMLGPLVARVGLVPDAMLVNQLQTVARIAPGRLIAALGTGDNKSKREHEVYRLAFQSVDERFAMLRDCCRRLRQRGITTWVGGTSPAVRRLAAEERVALNVWGILAADVAPLVDEQVEVTWGGPPPAEDVAGHIADLDAAGATWVVYGPPPSVDWPLEIDRLVAARNAQGGVGSSR